MIHGTIGAMNIVEELKSLFFAMQLTKEERLCSPKTGFVTILPYEQQGIVKKAVITAIVLALLSSGLFFLLKKNAQTPPQAITETVKIDLPQSTFNIPIKLEISTLADYLNNKITGQFLNTTLFLQKSKKEQIALTLTKTENITISSTGRELVCILPLTVNATLIDSRLGKTLSKLVTPFRTTIILTLSTPVDLDHSWRLKTRFRIKGYRWATEPILKIGPFRKNMRKTLDEAIERNSHKLTAMVDKEINKAASLRKTVAGVWSDLQEPIRINRNPAPVWIRFSCNEIKGDISLQQRAIICFASVKAKMLIVTDTTTSIKQSILPDFKKIEAKEKRSQSDIFVYANTSFREINQQLNERLQGRVISSKGYNITIKAIKAYASTEGLTISVDTSGDLNGRFFLTGRPAFDPLTKRLNITDFDFAVKSSSILINRGDDVLHDLLRERIASKLNLGLETLLWKLPVIINQAIAKGESGKTIELTVEKLEIKQCTILMGKEKIHFIINADTETTITLKKIKAGKAIRIR
jgi:hypothetical protein